MNQQIINNCKYILESRPKLRELINIREAIWTYFEEYCGIRDHLTRTDFLSARVPNFETLTSAFRTVKRKYPHLKGSDQSVSMQKERSQHFKRQFGYSESLSTNNDQRVEAELRRQRQMRID